MTKTRKTPALITAALALATAPAALSQKPAVVQPAGEQAVQPHMSFAVKQDILIDAPAATVLQVFQNPSSWTPQSDRREHVAGPAKGVGADYRVVTTRSGQTMTRRDLTIVADETRIVSRMLSDRPYPGTSFADFSVEPGGNAVRATFKIFVDATVPQEVPAEMIAAAVKHNESILAGHLQRIKAQAERSR